MKESQKSQRESREFVPDDVIAGILGFLDPPKETTYLTGDPRVIHEAIFALRDKYPLLKVFPFSQGDIYPFSRYLEEVLSRLQVARLLGMENPDFKRYIVKQRAKKIIRERVHKRFNDEQSAELQKIAREFEDRCLAPSQEE